MDILLRDLRILGAGTKLIRLLYLLKAALTVGTIVFTAFEIYRQWNSLNRKQLQSKY